MNLKLPQVKISQIDDYKELIETVLEDYPQMCEKLANFEVVNYECECMVNFHFISPICSLILKSCFYNVKAVILLSSSTRV